MGDVGPSEATWSYSFRGRRIIAAALSQLVTQHGLGSNFPGSTTTPRLVFGGCSAGARGAMVNLDFIEAELRALNVSMQARRGGATLARTHVHRAARARC